MATPVNWVPMPYTMALLVPVEVSQQGGMWVQQDGMNYPVMAMQQMPVQMMQMPQQQQLQQQLLPMPVAQQMPQLSQPQPGQRPAQIGLTLESSWPKRLGSQGFESSSTASGCSCDLQPLGPDIDDDDQHEDTELHSVQETQRLSTSAARRRRRQRAQERAEQAQAWRPAEAEMEPVSSSAKRSVLFAGGRISSERCTQLLAELQAATSLDICIFNELLAGCVLALSRDVLGCRVVQAALELCECQEALELLDGLRGHVRECVVSPHANYVIQKAVAQLPARTITFVAEELFGAAQRVVRHKYGCRIICRLVEFAGAEPSTLTLIEEVLVEAPELVCHSFGHHVIQSILEHGLARHRHIIAEALLQNSMKNAMHRCASFVLECALRHCSEEDKHAIVAHFGDLATIELLARSQYGCYFAVTLLRMPGVDFEAGRQRIECFFDELMTTRHGQMVLVALGLLEAVPDFEETA